MHKFFLSLLLVLLFSKANAQTDSGYVQFFVYPDSCHILLNKTVAVKAKQKLKLSVGDYDLSIKGKNYQPINTSIRIHKDSTVYYRKILEYNNEYKNYQKELTEYTIKRNLVYVSSAVIFFSGAYLTYNMMNNIKNKRDSRLVYAKLDQANYFLATNQADIDKYKNQFEKNKSDYHKYNKQIYLPIPIVIVSGYLSYRVFKYTKSLKKPSYLEPISLNYYNDLYNRHNFTINYKF